MNELLEAVWAVATAFTATSDNLGVAGELAGAPLLAASIAHIPALLLFLMCIAGLVISLSEEPPPYANIRSLR